MAAVESVQPAQFKRRSFVTRKLVAAGANFGALSDAAVALDFGDPDGEAAAARRLGLADLSPLPRVGFKGTGTPAWLAGQGLDVPEESNRATRQDDGALAARLSPGEVLVLDALSGTGGWPERLAAAWAAEPLPPPEPRGFPVPRAETHAWFLVTGNESAAMFAKLCGVDLRPARFDHGEIAQTSVARLTGAVIRDDRGGVPAYHLLADGASAAYLWDCLTDAMAEFDGAPVGLSAVRALG